MTAHTYWRVRFNTNGPNGPGYVVAEVGFCTMIGGSTVTTGGTAIESDHFGALVPANAFDGNTATIWAANTNTKDEYIGYEFVAPVDIVDMYITSDATFYAQTGIEFTLEYSDDGSTWFIKNFCITGVWSALQTQRFTPSSTDSTAAHAWWGFMPEDAVTTNGYGVGEFGFCATVGGSTQTTGGTARVTAGEEFNGSVLVANAFDGTDTTAWGSNDKFLGMGVSYAFTGPVTVEEVYIQAAVGVGLPNQTPDKFLVMYSSDGITFAMAWEQSTATWTTGGQLQRFANPNFGTSNKNRAFPTTSSRKFPIGNRAFP